MMSIIHEFDSSILLFIKSNMHGSIMDKIMVALTNLGEYGFIWIVIGVFLILNKKYRSVGLIVIGALIIATILGDGLIKHIIQRTRPSSDLAWVNMLIQKPLSYSFPSGHTASSFAAAGVLAKYFKRYAYVFFTLAFLIAFSRMYFYVHYPTDVIGGIVLGLICSRITILISEKVNFRRYFYRDEPNI